MPKWDQLQRLQIMQQRLSRYTVQRWAADFMEELDTSQSSHDGQLHKVITPDIEKKLIKNFQSAKKRLVILDYDGTLRKMVSSHQPQQSAPSKALRKLIKTLTDYPDTRVCIMSGRPRSVLETWFGGSNISLVAEHGAWVKDKDEWSQADFSFTKYRAVLTAILEQISERTPGAVIESKDFGLVWHYRNVVPELAHTRIASLKHELNQAIAGTELGIYSGHKIIELKPRSINKGSACLELLAMNPSDFILAIGDDYTDEAMFESLPQETFSIKVGLGKTYAAHQLRNVDQVLAILQKLTN